MSDDYIRATRAANLVETEFERLRRIDAAWSAYNGTNVLPVKVGTDGTDDNVRVNLARTIVDKSVSWLFGADRALALAADDEGDTARLDELWPINDRASVLAQAGVNGAVTGHVFLRLIEAPEIRVVVLDPSNMEVTWDADDFEHVTEFRYEWTTLDDDDDGDGNLVARRQTFTEAEGGGSWEIVDYESKASGDNWRETARDTWAHSFAPIFHCQNLPAPNEFWGQSDLEREVLELLDSMQFVLGYARKLLRHKGHPLPYVTGESADRIAELDAGIGRLLVLPNTDAKVGQLTSGDLGAALELYATLREALHETTRTPAIAFGTSMANVAEETVELAFAPAVEKTWDKRITYGPMISDLAGRILELANLPDRSPSPQWTPVVPRSAKSEAEALERDLRLGLVSRETAARKRGYEWSVELERMNEERRATEEQLAQAFNGGEIDFA
jgi:hypothetical protein